MSNNPMYRQELPRIYELRDSLPTPLPERVAFPALDKTISESPQKRKFLRDVEAVLQALDAAAWTALKAKLTPLPKRDKKRDLQPLYDTLNEAKAYNHLIRIGCANAHFIPLSMIEGQKTPDLGATDAHGRKVLCDAKSINISDREVARRRSGGVGTSTDQLDSGFLMKLKCDLEYAKAQIVAYDQNGATRKLAYVVVNYDDSLHEYDDLYQHQIAQFIKDNPIPELEVVFDIKPSFSSAQS
jgi:hypothetical protein